MWVLSAAAAAAAANVAAAAAAATAAVAAPAAAAVYVYLSRVKAALASSFSGLPDGGEHTPQSLLLQQLQQKKQ